MLLMMSHRSTDSLARELPSAERSWLALLIRACVSLGLVYGTYLVITQGVSLWHLRRQTLPKLVKAISWDPRNGGYYRARGRALQNSTENAEVSEAVRDYETAVRLNPGRAKWWAELGGVYEWAGREAEAERAFEKARELFPRSPEINWKLGNFYLRAGRRAKAFEALKRVQEGDPEMRRPVFDLAWRAGIEPAGILHELIPEETQTLLAYLDFLVETRHIDAAGEVWARLLASRHSFSAQAAFPYLDALIQQGRPEELRNAWGDVRERVPGGARESSRHGSEITNGGFEEELLNGGLDWRLIPAEGATISLDTMNFSEGRRALRIDIGGRQNLAYSHVLQFVPVRPNTGYRFLAYLRTQGILSDSGPRIEIYDNGDRGRLFLSTADVRGTTSWVPRSVDFRTGAETRVLVVRIARPVSRSLDGRIAGTVWIDRVSLRAVE